MVRITLAAHSWNAQEEADQADQERPHAELDPGIRDVEQNRAPAHQRDQRDRGDLGSERDRARLGPPAGLSRPSPYGVYQIGDV